MYVTVTHAQDILLATPAPQPPLLFGHCINPLLYTIFTTCSATLLLAGLHQLAPEL